MNRTIKISVQNLVAWQTNRVEYICDNSGFVVAFNFDSEWAAVNPKTARFIHGGEYTDIVFTGNKCSVPKITDVTRMEIGVFAGDITTTTPATVPCKTSILCGDGVPAEPTPDVYSQIMDVIFPEAVYAAEKSATAASESARNAKASETNAEQSQNAASVSERNAATSEQNAKTSEDNAMASEQNIIEVGKRVVQAEETAVNAKESAEEAERNAKTSEQNAAKSATEAKEAASSVNFPKPTESDAGMAI